MTKHEAGPLFAERDGIKIQHCFACGFAHQFPLPSDEWADDYYQTGKLYTDHASPGTLIKEAYEHRKGWWKPIYAYQSKLMGPFPFLIDVGCGPGWYVDHWLTYRKSLALGIEPDVHQRLQSPVPSHIYESWEALEPDYSNRLQLPRAQQVGEVQASLRAALVLEHIVNPRAFLAVCRKHLHPQGRFLLTVPSEFNPLQKRINQKAEYKDWFVAKPHINYFMPNSLRALLVDCGFRVVYETATFPIEAFAVLGWDYRGNEMLGRRCHNLRLKFERTLGPLAFTIYHQLYKRSRWGRELVFVVERRDT